MPLGWNASDALGLGDDEDDDEDEDEDDAMARGMAESCPDGWDEAEGLDMEESGEEACCRLDVDGGGDSALDEACGGVCIVGLRADSALPLPVRALGRSVAVLAGGGRLAEGMLVDSVAVDSVPVDSVLIDNVPVEGVLEEGVPEDGVLAGGTLADCRRSRSAQVEPLLWFVPEPLSLRGGADMGRKLLALRVEGAAPHRAATAGARGSPVRTRPHPATPGPRHARQRDRPRTSSRCGYAV